MADQPIDSSPAIAAILTQALSDKGIAVPVTTGFQPFPLPAERLPLILVVQTFCNSEVIENGWLRTQEREPNTYSIWVLLAELIPGVSFSASVALYDQIKPAVMRAFNTRTRQTLGGVVRAAGDPLRWRNDGQGPFITFMFKNYIGAQVSCGVWEQQEVIVDDTQ